MKKIEINELIELIEGNLVCKGISQTVENGYCGDFLSFVISRIPDNAVWFTVMNNANVAGVAKLGDVNAIVICENIKAENRLKECCDNEKINLIETPLTAFDCAARLGKRS